MSFDAGSAVGKLELETGEFSRGYLQAQSLMELFPSTVTNFLANPLLGVIGILKDLGGAFVDTFNEVQDYTDTVGDLAANLGVTTDALSALALSARPTGVELAGVGDAFKFLGKNMAEAATGNKEAAATFERLGITVTDVGGKMRPVEEVMLDVADAIAALPEGALRTQAAMDLLGRSGSDMVGLLSQGSAALREQRAEYERLGATITEAEAASADAWEKTKEHIDVASAGLKQRLVAPLRAEMIPALKDVGKETSELGKLFDFTAEGWAAQLGFVLDVLKGIAKAVEFLNRDPISPQLRSDLQGPNRPRPAHDVIPGEPRPGEVSVGGVRVVGEPFGGGDFGSGGDDVGGGDSSSGGGGGGRSAAFVIPSGPQVLPTSIDDSFIDGLQSLGSTLLPRLNTQVGETTRGLGLFDRELRDLRDEVRGLDEDLAAFRTNVLAPLNQSGQAGGAAAAAAGAGGQGGGGIGTVNVTTPQIDTYTASSQVAAAVLPQLRRGIDDAQRDYRSAFAASQAMEGMG